MVELDLIPGVVTKPDKYLSQSRINRIARCEGQYHAVYNLEQEEAPRMMTPADAGKNFHRANELFAHDGMEGGKDNLISKWELANEESPLLFDDFRGGKEILSEWWDGRDDFGTIIGIERPFCAVVMGVPYYGVWDLVERLDDETIRITDYKSNAQVMREWDMDRSFQGTIYVMSARRTIRGAKRVIFRYDFLKHSHIHETGRSGEDIMEFAVWGKGIWNRMNMTDPKYNIAGDCSWCPVKHGCPKYKEFMAALVDINSEFTPSAFDDVLALRGQVQIQKKMLEEKGAAIDSWLKRYTPEKVTCGSDFKVIHKINEKRVYEDSRIIDLLLKYDWFDDCVGLKKKEVDKRRKLLSKEDNEELIRLTTKKQTEYFRVYPIIDTPLASKKLEMIGDASQLERSY